METIKRKSGLRYRAMIWIDGKCLKSPVFKRKTDCIAWKATQLSKRNEGLLFSEDARRLKEKRPFAAYCQQWLELRAAKGLARATIRNYDCYLRTHVLRYFDGKDLKGITKEDLERFQIHMTKNHNAKGTNNVMAMLKSIFKDAHRDGYLARNPAQYIPKLKEDLKTDGFWAKAEVTQFLQANVRHALYDFFFIALNTGMRKGELAGLKWDRVDFGANLITVTRTRDGHELKERTKTALRRYIPMNPLVRTTLQRLHSSRLPSADDFVFLRRDGQPIDPHHLYREFQLAQKKAGFTRLIPLHGTRHTFASQFMMNGGNLFDLQKILGHTDVKMTLRYAHHAPEHLQNVMNGFELGADVFNQNLTTLPVREQKSPASLETYGA